MLPHISDDLSSSLIEKLEEMLQKYRGETVNFDSKKVRKFKEFEFPRPDKMKRRWQTVTAGEEKYRIYLNKIKKQIKQPLQARTDHTEKDPDVLFRKDLERYYDALFGTSDENE